MGLSKDSKIIGDIIKLVHNYFELLTKLTIRTKSYAETVKKKYFIFDFSTNNGNRSI